MNKNKLLYVSLAVASIYLLATYWPVIMVKAIQWQRILNHELAELIYDIEENTMAVFTLEKQGRGV